MGRLELQQMRTLIVDDNEINVLALEQMLATAGYANVASPSPGSPRSR